MTELRIDSKEKPAVTSDEGAYLLLAVPLCKLWRAVAAGPLGINCSHPFRKVSGHREVSDGFQITRKCMVCNQHNLD